MEAFKIGSVVFNKKTHCIGIVRKHSQREGVTLTDADGWVNSSELESHTNQKGHTAPSTAKEIESTKSQKYYQK
jgi:hypothetical protein